MDQTAAENFDRTRDFAAYWRLDPVGAALWCTSLLAATAASAQSIAPVTELLATLPSKQREPEVARELQAHQQAVTRFAQWLLQRDAASDADAPREVGLRCPAALPAPLLEGIVRVEPAGPDFAAVTRPVKALNTTIPLARQLTLEVAGRKLLLTCANEPLEAFGGDLSVFDGSFRVMVRGWPVGRTGKLFVEEACPVLPGYGPDFAHGRLFDQGRAEGPLFLRVNRELLIELEASHTTTLLRPFVGTGVSVYGTRKVDPASGEVRLAALQSDVWLLCRLQDPEDKDNKLPEAPAPEVQPDGRVLFIGGTPPWNWQGPNIRTHLITPPGTQGLIRASERRVLFGQPLACLPSGMRNPLEPVRRVFAAHLVCDRDTDTDAHWGTRLAPITAVERTLAAAAQLTFASSIVSRATAVQALV